MIGDGSIATPAKDEKTAHTPVVPGNSGFSPFSGLARHAGAAELQRATEKKSLRTKVSTRRFRFHDKGGLGFASYLSSDDCGAFPKDLQDPCNKVPRHVIRTTWVLSKKWVEIEKEVDIRTLDNRVAKLPSESPVLSVTIFKRPPGDPEPEPEKLKLRQMTKSVQPSSSCRPEAWNTSLRTVPRTLSARYVKRPKCWRRMPESEGGAPLSFQRSSETT